MKKAGLYAHAIDTRPSLYAFSHTVPAQSKRGSFIIAGSGEAHEGTGSYRARADHGELLSMRDHG